MRVGAGQARVGAGLARGVRVAGGQRIRRDRVKCTGALPDQAVGSDLERENTGL